MVEEVTESINNQPDLDVDAENVQIDVVLEAKPKALLKNAEWFILQTYSGHEFKVKLSIEQRVKALNIEAQIFDILVPEENTIEIKNNKKYEKKRKLYPGYVFIKMVYSEELWHLIKLVPGMSKFMGRQSKPAPVVDDEMLKVLRQVGMKVQKYQIDFEIGDAVKIITGPFRGYSGPVKEINLEKGKVRTMLMIFGRETPAELDFDQVERQK